MKAVILIAVILTFSACFLSADAHKRKRQKESSSEENVNLCKQRNSRPSKDERFRHRLQAHKDSAKLGHAPESPRGHRAAHGPHRPGRPHHPRHPHCPHGSLPSSTRPSAKVVNPGSQAPPATSRGPTTAANNAPAVTTAALSASVSSTGAAATPIPLTAPSLRPRQQRLTPAQQQQQL